MSKNNFIKLLIIIILAAPLKPRANQIKAADDGAEINAFIAKQELNRIHTIGDRIRAVKKNEGEFTANIDEKLGDIYIKSTAEDNKKINLFLITEKNFTYKLLLEPKEISSEQIFIKNDSVSLKLAKAEQVSNDVYNKQLIELYKLLALDKNDKSYNLISDKLEKYDANNKIKLKRIKQLVGRNYIGEVYEICNLNKTDFIIREENFYNKSVVLVSSPQEKLAYKETGLLYIIKEAL